MHNKGQEGEEFVNEIAYKTFLKYWCFPSPLNITKDNKEISDLLIIFGDSLVILSVKNYDFKGNYARYFRKTISKAVKQITGAERTLFEQQNVLLTHPVRKTIKFESSTIKNVIRIIVNLNTNVKYYQTHLFKNGNPISIMDAEAWKTLITELNTPKDLIRFLTSRESLFSSYPAFILPRYEFDFDENSAKSLLEELDAARQEYNHLGLVSGTELDLVASFIKSNNKFPKQLNYDDKNLLYLKIDGEWDNYLNSSLRPLQQKINQESQFWDDLIKEMLEYGEKADVLAKMIFKLDRLERRVFLDHYNEYLDGVPENANYNRTHYVGLNMNLVLMVYSEDFPEKELELITQLALYHHAYLHDFGVEEIGLLGTSKDKTMYTFGTMKGTMQPSQEHLEFLVKEFKRLGWQIK